MATAEPSTRNTRIERLWVEVGTQFARRWRGFFTRLERMHGLDHDNPHHLWLLHYLFLDAINLDCQNSRLNGTVIRWEEPGIKGWHRRTYSFISETEHGVEEDQPGVHPSVLEEFYGVEEDHDDEWEGVDDLIADEQANDIRHEAVEVPSNGSPFSPELQAVFFDALQEVQAQEIIPEDFGLLLDSYPTTETIHLGRGGKKITVVLPLDIWLPRALAWAQGLELMNGLIVEAQ
ncbi:hypothetical protein C8J57DRAFT_1438317 [Mycena rebaudengoi]|nr:hypothetical protein C8J57DRAFT_1438317 [Mycena rebaudengoi]